MELPHGNLVTTMNVAPMNFLRMLKLKEVILAWDLTRCHYGWLPTASLNRKENGGRLIARGLKKYFIEIHIGKDISGNKRKEINLLVSNKLKSKVKK